MPPAVPKRVRLLHWKPEEVPERAARLAALGHRVDASPLEGPATLKALRADPPDAVVIDLSRLPTQGRDVGIALRTAKATRFVPLVFVGGEARKVETVRRSLPDAVFTSWADLGPALALAHPPTAPVVPASNLAGYSGTPLPKKLNIKAGSAVTLLGAPKGFAATLGELPEGARLQAGGEELGDVVLWFVRRRAELEEGIGSLARRLGRSYLWIAWPKKASGIESDVSETTVRTKGLAEGLVDSKICAIDAIWSGLRFTVRRR